MKALFEKKPRWPGAPPICIAVNLPALDTLADLNSFLKKNGPACKVEQTWQCETCKKWHAKTQPPDPAGSSSGVGRSSKGR